MAFGTWDCAKHVLQFHVISVLNWRLQGATFRRLQVENDICNVEQQRHKKLHHSPLLLPLALLIMWQQQRRKKMMPVVGPPGFPARPPLPLTHFKNLTVGHMRDYLS